MNAMKLTEAPKVNEKRLLAYAAAAGAALAVAGPADASVIYGTVDATVSGATTLPVSMRTGNTLYFFRAINAGNIYGSVHGIANALNVGGFIVASNFPQGATNAAGKYNADNLQLFKKPVSGATGGNFKAPDGGYLRVKLDPSGTPLTGWVQIDQIAADYSSYHVKDWAYETDPSQRIVVGATAVPEPTSSALALIAMGAGGLAVMRRGKQEKREREGA